MTYLVFVSKELLAYSELTTMDISFYVDKDTQGTLNLKHLLV